MSGLDLANVALRARVLLLASTLVMLPAVARAQIEWGTIAGTVLQPGGGSAAAAEVRVHDSLGALIASAQTDAAGRFTIPGVPPGDYWLTAEAPGRLLASQRAVIRGPRLETTLTLQPRMAETVDVSAGEERPDVRSAFGGDTVRRLVDRLRSRALRDALASAGGWAREDNGLVHHRGADDGFLFVLDGVPVYERLDPLFGLSPEAATIDSFQVLSGYVPPQYGLRSGGVVEMRSLSSVRSDDRWESEAEVASGTESTRSAAGLLRGDSWFTGDRALNFETPADWAEALKGTSEWMAINLDVGHFAAAGQDPVAFFEANHTRIVSVHVKDRAADKEHTFVRFGKGATPIVAFARVLRETGFKYAANLELEIEEPDPAEGLREDFEYFTKALA